MTNYIFEKYVSAIQNKTDDYFSQNRSLTTFWKALGQAHCKSAGGRTQIMKVIGQNHLLITTFSQ